MQLPKSPHLEPDHQALREELQPRLGAPLPGTELGRLQRLPLLAWLRVELGLVQLREELPRFASHFRDWSGRK